MALIMWVTWKAGLLRKRYQDWRIDGKYQSHRVAMGYHPVKGQPTEPTGPTRTFGTTMDEQGNIRWTENP
jgi:hypothetical protein